MIDDSNTIENENGGMLVGEITVAEMLKKQGYRIGFFQQRKFKSMIRCLLALCVIFGAAVDGFAVAPPSTEGFSVSRDSGQVTIQYDGRLVSRYHFRDSDARKPYFWPVIGPTGKSMTRAFPMETVAGEQQDHPHHRGVWFGHQGVAGSDTWLEAASQNFEGERQKKFLVRLGSIVHTGFTEVSANENQAVIRCTNDYLDSSGKQLMADRRSMIFRMTNGNVVMDFDIKLLAKYGDVKLQDKKDAGLNVRVPTSMSLTDGKGHIVNSVGERDGETWSKQADWVDYHGQVSGEQLGIAFLNHPSSFRHPTRWHVREYGLFTANAFGPKSLSPGEPSGTFVLKDGESVDLRHRIIFHKGDEIAAGIAAAYQAYAAAEVAELQESDAAESWTQFRGNDGTSSSLAKTPINWTEQDFKWKTELPGRGWSSPVYHDGKIWVTSAIEETASEEEIAKKLEDVQFAKIKTAARAVQLFAICVDLKSGKLVKNIPLGTVSDPEPINPMNSYASPTCAILGGKVVCHFGAYGTWCLDTKSGDVLWHREFIIKHSVGPGSSPVIFDDKAIFVCDGMDQQYLVAVSLDDGETVWKTDRPPMKTENGEYRKSYSTPIFIDVAGKTEAVVPGSQWIVAYDPSDGTEIWRADYGFGFSVTPMAVYSDGIVAFSTAYKHKEFVGVRPGSGDISDSGIVWRGRNAPSMSSFICDDGKLFAISDSGVALCLDMKTGKALGKKRMLANVSASLLKSNGHFYVANRNGQMKVVKCDPEMEVVGEHDFGSPVFATPAVVENDLIIRTKDFLVRVGK